MFYDELTSDVQGLWKGMRCVCPTDSECACGAAEGNGPCSATAGHEWIVSEETDRSYCLNCGADGDA